ncbi:N-acetyltransferase [Vibrio navarrensis]|uniref:GNAT family N-acetyltransferase n=1 Tax=Vibrio navarrensis TaxID=29495 RepID=A0AAI9CY64_9VIBR|nr:N-acetyltransferase [Vibrio navarrensis]EKA5638230.1 GNAT family N-acetyltransferase [Vibrio navarrensis]ELN6934572.1 GNAT family N-acetyltransferase [Vibrio navarrensis]
MAHTIRIERLDPIKLPMVKKLYKSYYPSAKAKTDEQIIVAYQEHQMVGLVRFKPIEEWLLLTGMLVIPTHRQQGVGHALLSYCRENTLNSHCYCFAYPHLPPFYAQHGFKTIELDALPNSLKQKYLRYCESGKDLIPMQFIDD